MFDRQTIVSSSVLAILEHAKNPLSASNIISLLAKQSLHPNKATVYRILKKLRERHVISEFNSKNGLTYYEITHTHHHHHFICDLCTTAYCLNGCHIDLNAIHAQSMLPNQQFSIRSHDFNLYGVCDKCSTN